MKNFFQKTLEKILWLIQLIKNQILKIWREIHPLPWWKQKRVIIPVISGIAVLILIIVIIFAKKTPTKQYDTLAQLVPDSSSLYIHWNKNLTPATLINKSWDKEILNYVWPEDLRPKNLSLNKDFSSLINSEVATVILTPNKEGLALIWLARVDDKKTFQDYLDSNEVPKRSDVKTPGTHYLWLDDNVIVLSNNVESLNLIEQTKDNSLLKQIPASQINSPALFSLTTHGDWLASYYSNSQNPVQKLIAQEISNSKLITLSAQAFDDAGLKISGSIARPGQEAETNQSVSWSWIPPDAILYAQGHWLRSLITLFEQNKDSSLNNLKTSLSSWYDIDWDKQLAPIFSQSWSTIAFPRTDKATAWPWIATAKDEQINSDSQNLIVNLAKNYFARNYAKEVEKKLPDGSKATELVADPEQVKWTDVDWPENLAKISLLKQGSEEFVWGNIAEKYLILANSLTNSKLLLEANQNKQGTNLDDLRKNCWQKEELPEQLYLANLANIGLKSLLLGMNDDKDTSNVYACLNF